ncbi:MAG TPA: DUF983 domain-containing protein [Longimicrobiales bacterium]
MRSGTTMVRSEPQEFDLWRAVRYLRRALKLRCPHCGVGRMFSSWLGMRERCTVCGLRFDRGESDHFIGAYLINLIVAELLVVAGLLLLAAVTWPDVPWDFLTYALAVLIVPAPFITYPFSKAVWLAIDVTFRPVERADIE